MKALLYCGLADDEMSVSILKDKKGGFMVRARANGATRPMPRSPQWIVHFLCEQAFYDPHRRKPKAVVHDQGLDESG